MKCFLNTSTVYWLMIIFIQPYGLRLTHSLLHLLPSKAFNKLVLKKKKKNHEWCFCHSFCSNKQSTWHIVGIQNRYVSLRKYRQILFGIEDYKWFSFNLYFAQELIKAWVQGRLREGNMNVKAVKYIFAFYSFRGMQPTNAFAFFFPRIWDNIFCISLKALPVKSNEIVPF